ncbi:MAG TPA: Gfo/Idh/MocA family oxidoreductase [Acidimicrobiia bacterium]|nr:Gfo/Idh/MocA family oxidoreductase [Acidimicrobiia bacterium]
MSPDESPGLGWAVLGASWIAEAFVIDAIRSVPGSEVVGVYSTSAERGRSYAERTGVREVWSSLESALADQRVEAVFVGTRNELHHDQVLAAAAAGRHILCEKPLALTASDAIDMRDAAVAAGVVLATNHAFRDQAPLRKMREMIAAGTIGTPVAARTFFGVTLIDRVKTWRLSDRVAGGVLLDVSVHTVDILRHLLDSEVAAVQAMIGNQGVAAAGVEDIATGTLLFENGVLSNFHDSYTVNHVPSSVEVHGDAGSLVATGVLSVHPAGDLRLMVDGVAHSVDSGPMIGPYMMTLRSFTYAVRGAGAPSASADDGIRSLEAVIAAHRSASTGQMVQVARLGESA